MMRLRRPCSPPRKTTRVLSMAWLIPVLGLMVLASAAAQAPGLGSSAELVDPLVLSPLAGQQIAVLRRSRPVPSARAAFRPPLE